MDDLQSSANSNIGLFPLSNIKYNLCAVDCMSLLSHSKGTAAQRQFLYKRHSLLPVDIWATVLGLSKAWMDRGFSTDQKYVSKKDKKRAIDSLGLMIWLCFHKTPLACSLHLISETQQHFQNKPVGLLLFSFILLDTMAIIWTPQTFENTAPNPKMIQNSYINFN